MKDHSRRIRIAVLVRYIFLFTLITFIISACAKKSDDIPPLPYWEDNGPDSTLLTVLVQTNQGIVLNGQNVSLALSQDSLNSKTLVRQAVTSVAGRAIFRKLYPRHMYYYCIAVYNGNIYQGFGNIKLRPSDTRDTLLIVH